MKKSNIELVKESWALVTALDMETVGGIFYTRLFSISPELKPLFTRTPIPEQSKKLLTMLSYVISRLDKLEEIQQEIANLARRHTQYGVKEEHYSAVGAALLWTLEKGLGEHWNDELNQAWTSIYKSLSGVMVSAQKEEQSKNPAAGAIGTI